MQPGSIDTDMNPTDGQAVEGQRALITPGHCGTPADIGAAVAFLASPAAQQLTGPRLNIDGATNA